LTEASGGAAPPAHVGTPAHGAKCTEHHGVRSRGAHRAKQVRGTATTLTNFPPHFGWARGCTPHTTHGAGDAPQPVRVHRARRGEKFPHARTVWPPHSSPQQVLARKPRAPKSDTPCPVIKWRPKALWIAQGCQTLHGPYVPAPAQRNSHPTQHPTHPPHTTPTAKGAQVAVREPGANTTRKQGSVEKPPAARHRHQHHQQQQQQVACVRLVHVWARAT
jgi:hypothetical protein